MKPTNLALLAVCFLFTACAAQRTATTSVTTTSVVSLDSFKLVGTLTNNRATFTLTATARVESKGGGSLELVSGPVALTELGAHPKWGLKADQNKFLVTFDRAGSFPLQLKFDAAVRQNDGWNSVEFRVASSALQPLTLRGLPADTQFEFPGGARPERAGGDFKTFLPSDGTVKLSWKEAHPEAEGKLFYAAEMLSQISVSPGLMRAVSLINFKIMQGELSKVALLVQGAGEVTRVQGDQVLAWNLEPVPNSTDRRLIVQFNQPQKDQFMLQVQTQTPLGAFPQTADTTRLRPEGATRFAGYFRIVNEGAVRLEVAQAAGLSQISPEQFPESDATRAALRLTGSQRFAYRFSGPDFALRIQADQILPELAVSELLAYRLGDNELAIDGELELDIREAPLRELLLRVPKGYAVARLNAPGLSDYFVTELENDSELRLVYGQPVSGRQVVQLRLERNKALGEATWTLPRVEVAKAKTVRGHVAVAADAGFRLTPDRTQALTEIATAFFPGKVSGIQAAFRLSDPAWQASVRVERLPQTVQADALHIFSIGEGIAYGSSVMNYVISGAPVSVFKIELSDEYFNVEFTGKDIRGSQKTDGGYLVQLHTPVSGTYTLLATYERPFKAQGETLTFTGARPLDAQTEQGHTLIISAYQFQVRPADVSAGLLPLETGEVPPEYRLFFDAPILAAYHYTSRPFNLKLALSPLAQGDSLSQVVDRASLVTRISKEGQVLTDVSYFVKNRGNPHLRLGLPAGTTLWSASVNDAPVVPVLDAGANLIPLPQRADPSAVLKVDLKLAAPAKEPRRVSVSAPRLLNVPVMLAEWKLEPDTAQRLAYRSGSLTPMGGVLDASGFAQLRRALAGEDAGRARMLFAGSLVLVAVALLLWQGISRDGVYRPSPRYFAGLALGIIAVAFSLVAFANLAGILGQGKIEVARDLSFLAPVQEAGSTLSLEVSNVPDKPSAWGLIGSAWPALLGLALCGYAWGGNKQGLRGLANIVGWTCLAWAALRCPNGAVAFVLVIVAFLLLQVVMPALLRLWRLPPEPAPDKSARLGGTASAAAALVIGGMMWLNLTGVSNASEQAEGAVSTAQPRRGAMFIEERLTRLVPSPSGARCLHSDAPAVTPVSVLASRPYGAEQYHKRAGDYKHRAPTGLARRPESGRHTSRPRLASRAEVRPEPGQNAVLSDPPRNAESPRAESVTQEIRVEDQFALATARIRWQAQCGEILPLLYEPAVLTHINYPSNSLTLQQGSAGSRCAQQLRARRQGLFDLEIQYQLPVTKREPENGLTLPVPYGLVNQLRLTVANLDVDVSSPSAVSLQRDSAGSNTVATLVLSPAGETWVGWKPRSRDVKREKPVFYAEVSQLYVPAAGVIEGAHFVSVRPAQGELSELVFDVPANATVTDVLDAAKLPDSKLPKAMGAPGPLVSLWRFDPDTRKLRVSLNPPQSRPFYLLIRSQVPTGPLPLEQTVGLLAVQGAAGQIGLLGVATGTEVQLDSVTGAGLSPINLEDFPGDTTPALQGQVPGLTVRRAFRYSETQTLAALKASAVEPDVRVETQDTLSLGEDRTILAANATVQITRAGIFRLSFLMPAGFDVESISGSALSHWTELKTDAGRVITLHLTGKTEGQQQFAVSLAGPGVKATNSWQVPQLVLREASKQRGTLLLVPEQGLRLQVAASEGLTQLDPQKSGIKQKGVLAFRVLQTPRSLALDIERVDSWVQVTSLQHATVSEALIKVAANLQYQIENTGLKSFRISIPTNAESVRFQGEQVADFLPIPGTATNGFQTWEIKLHRRVIGPYLVQATYHTPTPENAPEIVLRGIQAEGVNLQRGFVTIQSSGRLQVRVDAPPAALQPAEWQSIPRALQQGLPTTAANFAYRLVEPAFQLPLKLDRHEAAKLLAARVNNLTLSSTISDDGVMLTQVRLELVPGDKRLLNLTLPSQAQFWFAFVNRNGVWPWREQDRLLIPLEQPARGDQVIPVELFYSSRIGAADPRALDLELLAPKFDLPLENIKWRVCLSDKWQVKKWSGSLQLQQEEILSRNAGLDLSGYLQSEAADQRERTKIAEDLLIAGNSALEQGDPQQARRSFQAAYGLSGHDAAFNEDARVQLHNIKLQQALIGLNVRQAASTGEPGAPLGGRFRDLHSRKELNYTQQDAKDIIDRNTADDNAAFMRLAERLIQQQDAAVSSPAALRANLPEQGRVLTFQRAIVVDPWADLRIGLRASAVKAAAWGARTAVLVATLALLAAFGWWGRSRA